MHASQPINAEQPKSPGNSLLYVPARGEKCYHSLFCAQQADARALQLLSQLRAISTIEFFSQHPDRSEELRKLVDALHTPASIAAARPDLIGAESWMGMARNRVAIMLRRLGLPMPGIRNPLFVTEQLPPIYTKCQPAVQETLKSNNPDFLFVSTQTNPLAQTLSTNAVDTRMILIVQQLEAERMQALADSSSPITRLARTWEAARARRFEQENLALYDAVIVATEHDRERLVACYGFPTERIRVIGKDGDPDFDAWLAALKTLPRRDDVVVVRAPNSSLMLAA